MARRVNKPVADWLRKAFALAVLRVLRVRAHVPGGAIDALKGGRVIVVANHVSLLDGVLIALISPVPLLFGVDPLFSRRSRGARLGMGALSWMGFGEVVPLDSSTPFGLRRLERYLADGRSVMVFPEGAISADGRPLPFQPGVGWLVRRCQASVVRVAILGAERSRLFAKRGEAWWPKIEVVFCGELALRQGRNQTVASGSIVDVGNHLIM